MRPLILALATILIISDSTTSCPISSWDEAYKFTLECISSKFFNELENESATNDTELVPQRSFISTKQYYCLQNLLHDCPPDIFSYIAGEFPAFLEEGLKFPKLQLSSFESYGNGHRNFSKAKDKTMESFVSADERLTYPAMKFTNSPELFVTETSAVGHHGVFKHDSVRNKRADMPKYTYLVTRTFRIDAPSHSKTGTLKPTTYNTLMVTPPGLQTPYMKILAGTTKHGHVTPLCITFHSKLPMWSTRMLMRKPFTSPLHGHLTTPVTSPFNRTIPSKTVSDTKTDTTRKFRKTATVKKFSTYEPTYTKRILKLTPSTYPWNIHYTYPRTLVYNQTIPSKTVSGIMTATTKRIRWPPTAEIIATKKPTAGTRLFRFTPPGFPWTFRVTFPDTLAYNKTIPSKTVSGTMTATTKRVRRPPTAKTVSGTLTATTKRVRRPPTVEVIVTKKPTPGTRKFRFTPPGFPWTHHVTFPKTIEYNQTIPSKTVSGSVTATTKRERWPPTAEIISTQKPTIGTRIFRFTPTTGAVYTKEPTIKTIVIDITPKTEIFSTEKYTPATRVFRLTPTTGAFSTKEPTLKTFVVYVTPKTEIISKEKPTAGTRRFRLMPTTGTMSTGKPTVGTIVVAVTPRTEVIYREKPTPGTKRFRVTPPSEAVSTGRPTTKTSIISVTPRTEIIYREKPTLGTKIYRITPPPEIISKEKPTPVTRKFRLIPHTYPWEVSVTYPRTLLYNQTIPSKTVSISMTATSKVMRQTPRVVTFYREKPTVGTRKFRLTPWPKTVLTEKPTLPTMVVVITPYRRKESDVMPTESTYIIRFTPRTILGATHFKYPTTVRYSYTIPSKTMSYSRTFGTTLIYTMRPRTEIVSVTEPTFGTRIFRLTPRIEIHSTKKHTPGTKIFSVSPFTEVVHKKKPTNATVVINITPETIVDKDIKPPLTDIISYKVPSKTMSNTRTVGTTLIYTMRPETETVIGKEPTRGTRIFWLTPRMVTKFAKEDTRDTTRIHMSPPTESFYTWMPTYGTRFITFRPDVTPYVSRMESPPTEMLNVTVPSKSVSTGITPSTTETATCIPEVRTYTRAVQGTTDAFNFTVLSKTISALRPAGITKIYESTGYPMRTTTTGTEYSTTTTATTTPGTEIPTATTTTNGTEIPTATTTPGTGIPMTTTTTTPGTEILITTTTTPGTDYPKTTTAFPGPATICYPVTTESPFPICSEAIMEAWITKVRKCIIDRMRAFGCIIERDIDLIFTKGLKSNATLCIKTIGDTICRPKKFNLFHRITFSTVNLVSAHGAKALEFYRSGTVSQNAKVCLSRLRVEKHCAPELITSLEHIVLFNEIPPDNYVTVPKNHTCLQEEFQDCDLQTKLFLEKIIAILLDTCFKLTLPGDDSICEMIIKGEREEKCDSFTIQSWKLRMKKCMQSSCALNDTSFVLGSNLQGFYSEKFIDCINKCFLQEKGLKCMRGNISHFTNVTKFFITAIDKLMAPSKQCSEKLKFENVEHCVLNMYTVTSILSKYTDTATSPPIDRFVNCFYEKFKPCPRNIIDGFLFLMSNLCNFQFQYDNEYVKHKETLFTDFRVNQGAVTICETVVPENLKETTPLPGTRFETRQERNDTTTTSKIMHRRDISAWETSLQNLYLPECSMKHLQLWLFSFRSCMKMQDLDFYNGNGKFPIMLSNVITKCVKLVGRSCYTRWQNIELFMNEVVHSASRLASMWFKEKNVSCASCIASLRSMRFKRCFSKISHNILFLHGMSTGKYQSIFIEGVYNCIPDKFAKCIELTRFLLKVAIKTLTSTNVFMSHTIEKYELLQKSHTYYFTSTVFVPSTNKEMVHSGSLFTDVCTFVTDVYTFLWKKFLKVLYDVNPIRLSII